MPNSHDERSLSYDSATPSPNPNNLSMNTNSASSSPLIPVTPSPSNVHLQFPTIDEELAFWMRRTKPLGDRMNNSPYTLGTESFRKRKRYHTSTVELASEQKDGENVDARMRARSNSVHNSQRLTIERTRAFQNASHFFQQFSSTPSKSLLSTPPSVSHFSRGTFIHHQPKSSDGKIFKNALALIGTTNTFDGGTVDTILYRTPNSNDRKSSARHFKQSANDDIDTSLLVTQDKDPNTSPRSLDEVVFPRAPSASPAPEMLASSSIEPIADQSHSPELAPMSSFSIALSLSLPCSPVPPASDHDEIHTETTLPLYSIADVDVKDIELCALNLNIPTQVVENETLSSEPSPQLSSPDSLDMHDLNTTYSVSERLKVGEQVLSDVAFFLNDDVAADADEMNAHIPHTLSTVIEEGNSFQADRSFEALDTGDIDLRDDLYLALSSVPYLPSAKSHLEDRAPDLPLDSSSNTPPYSPSVLRPAVKDITCPEFVPSPTHNFLSSLSSSTSAKPDYIPDLGAELESCWSTSTITSWCAEDKEGSIWTSYAPRSPTPDIPRAAQSSPCASPPLRHLLALSTDSPLASVRLEFGNGGNSFEDSVEAEVSDLYMPTPSVFVNFETSPLSSEIGEEAEPQADPVVKRFRTQFRDVLLEWLGVGIADVCNPADTEYIQSIAEFVVTQLEKGEDREDIAWSLKGPLGEHATEFVDVLFEAINANPDIAVLEVQEPQPPPSPPTVDAPHEESSSGFTHFTHSSGSVESLGTFSEPSFYSPGVLDIRPAASTPSQTENLSPRTRRSRSLPVIPSNSTTPSIASFSQESAPVGDLDLSGGSDASASPIASYQSSISVAESPTFQTPASFHPDDNANSPEEQDGSRVVYESPFSFDSSSLSYETERRDSDTTPVFTSPHRVPLPRPSETLDPEVHEPSESSRLHDAEEEVVDVLTPTEVKYIEPTDDFLPTFHESRRRRVAMSSSDASEPLYMRRRVLRYSTTRASAPLCCRCRLPLPHSVQLDNRPNNSQFTIRNYHSSCFHDASKRAPGPVQPPGHLAQVFRFLRGWAGAEVRELYCVFMAVVWFWYRVLSSF